MKKLLFPLFMILLISCSDDQDGSTADKIIEKAIKEAGGERYENAFISFRFRENIYSSLRREGRFELVRIKKDSLGEVKDVLTNEETRRYRNGSIVKLSDSLAKVIGESINSVHYFVHLPFGLDQEAVVKKLVGQDSIGGKAYYEIKVTFKEEGGGKDHEDIYMYWVEKKNFTVDYLAYRFFVNEGGIRFRKAVNPRKVQGIRFVDYENYKTEQLDVPLEQLDELYLKDRLEKVSQIENQILEVRVDDL